MRFKPAIMQPHTTVHANHDHFKCLTNHTIVPRKEIYLGSLQVMCRKSVRLHKCSREKKIISIFFNLLPGWRICTQKNKPQSFTINYSAVSHRRVHQVDESFVRHWYR